MSFLFAWITSLSNTDPTENSSSLFETRNWIFQILKKMQEYPKRQPFQQRELLSLTTPWLLNIYTLFFVRFKRANILKHCYINYQLHIMSTMYLPHIYDMVDGYLRLTGSVRVQVVQEQLIITDHYKLALPAFPYSSRFGYLLEKD